MRTYYTSNNSPQFLRENHQLCRSLLHDNLTILKQFQIDIRTPSCVKWIKTNVHDVNKWTPEYTADFTYSRGGGCHPTMKIGLAEIQTVFNLKSTRAFKNSTTHWLTSAGAHGTGNPYEPYLTIDNIQAMLCLQSENKSTDIDASLSASRNQLHCD